MHLFAGEITQKQETDFHENLKKIRTVFGQGKSSLNFGSIYSMSQKFYTPKVFKKFFSHWLRALIKILHAYCTFISTSNFIELSLAFFEEVVTYT